MISPASPYNACKEIYDLTHIEDCVGSERIKCFRDRARTPLTEISFFLYNTMYSSSFARKTFISVSILIPFMSPNFSLRFPPFPPNCSTCNYQSPLYYGMRILKELFGRVQVCCNKCRICRFYRGTMRGRPLSIRILFVLRNFLHSYSYLSP